MFVYFILLIPSRRFALSKSSHKRKEVGQELATKILKIKLPYFQNKKGHAGKGLISIEEKVDRKKIYLQKNYLLWTLEEVIDLANNSEPENSFLNKFGKNVTFRKVYSFL